MSEDKQEKKSSLDFACEFIGERYGTCPVDLLGWDAPHGCDRECGKLDIDAQLVHCWKLYFIEKEFNLKQGSNENKNS